MKDETDFQAAINLALTAFQNDAVALADYLNTSRANITRWANGETEPTAGMRSIYYPLLYNIDLDNMPLRSDGEDT